MENAIAAKDIDLCTCIKDDENSTTQNLIRETIKGFGNPWTFRIGELCDAYEQAQERGILNKLEPHTTSLYFALGKRLWFSQSTAISAKITTRGDLDLFDGYLLLQEKRRHKMEHEVFAMITYKEFEVIRTILKNPAHCSAEGGLSEQALLCL